MAFKAKWQRYMKAKPYQVFIALFILFSFCDERTLFSVAGSTLIDPRLFDIGFVLALMSLPFIRKTPLSANSALRFPQKHLLIIFSLFMLAGLVTTFILYPDPAISRYSLFFMYRYVQVAIIILFFLKVNFTAKQWHNLYLGMIIFSVWPVFYAYGQIFGIFDRFREIEGLTSINKVIYDIQYITFYCSTLGYHYSHLANFAAIIGLFTSFYVINARTMPKKILSLLYMLICLPLSFLSGARSGIFLPFIYFGMAFLFIFMSGTTPRYRRQSHGKGIYFVILVVVFSFMILSINYLFTRETSLGEIRSFNVLRTLAERREGSDILDRILEGPNWVLTQLSQDDVVRRIILGDGFYGRYDLRYGYVGGYGLHSSFFFPWEQGGIIAFITVILLLLEIVKLGLRIIQYVPSNDQWRFAAMSALIISAFIAELGGGSGGGFMWMSSTILTGSTFLLVFGLVVPYRWVMAMGVESVITRNATNNGCVHRESR